MSQADGTIVGAAATKPASAVKKRPPRPMTIGDLSKHIAEARDAARVTSVEDLMRRFGVQRRTIQKWLRTLEMQGRITREDKGNGILKLVWVGIGGRSQVQRRKTPSEPLLRLVEGQASTTGTVRPPTSPRRVKKLNDTSEVDGISQRTALSSDIEHAPLSKPEPVTEPVRVPVTSTVRDKGRELYTAQPVPTIPLTMPSAVTSDGRVNLSPLVGNAVIALICALGAAAFVWLGIHALDVTLRINGWFAASIAGTEETRPLFATAFNVIGYLAAGGPIAAHILFTLRLRSAGWLATGFAIIFAAFGIFAASGFVATNTDASSEERRVMHARLSSADADIKRAREAIDKAGVLPDEATVSKDLASSIKAIRGGERACDAKKLTKTVERLCERVKDLRDDLRRIATDAEARRLLASATEARKVAEAEAKAKNVTIGSEINPMAAKLATVMPMTPETIGLVAFFLEAWGPELAVLVCFWLAGLLAVSAATTLFRVREP